MSEISLAGYSLSDCLSYPLAPSRQSGVSLSSQMRIRRDGRDNVDLQACMEMRSSTAGG